VQAESVVSVSAALLLNDQQSTTLDAVSSTSVQASLASVVESRIEILQSVNNDIQVVESLVLALTVAKSQSDNLGLFENTDAVAEIKTAVENNASFEEDVKNALLAFVTSSETFTLVDNINATEGILTVDLPDGRTITIDPGSRTYTISAGSRIIKPST